MHKCRKCLCKSCMKSCKCTECKKHKKGGTVKKCENHEEFAQLSLFEPTEKTEKKKLLRDVTWKDYGLDDKEYRNELKRKCMSGEYYDLARSAAYRANPYIAEYILLSATKSKTYEGVEYNKNLGRIACGRTDFYGYRRLFYYYFSSALNLVQTTKQCVR